MMRILATLIRPTIFFMVLVSLSLSQAQEESAEDTKEMDQAIKEAPAARPSTGSGSSKLLDFEADVIEGQRKAPQLFLQMEIESPNLDTVIYNRKNFNDFHVIDKDRRTLYQPVPKGK